MSFVIIDICTDVKKKNKCLIPMLIFSGIFSFTFRDMGYLGKLILEIFAYLLKGIWDICLLTSRDMGY